MAKTPLKRTTAGLRDALFDEIERMQGPEGDPSRAMAIANLSKQIINTAKVELDFRRTMAELDAQGGEKISLGTLVLGAQ